MSLDDSKFFSLIGFMFLGFGFFVFIMYGIMAWKLSSDWILTDTLWRVFTMGLGVTSVGFVLIGIGAILSKLKTLSS